MNHAYLCFGKKKILKEINNTLKRNKKKSQNKLSSKKKTKNINSIILK